MTRCTLHVSSLVAIAALVSGCASAPTATTVPTHSAAPDCRQLSAEIAKSEEAKRAALEKEKGAWKVVVPVAVVARYTSGKMAAASSDKQLEKLRAEFTRQGCAHQGN